MSQIFPATDPESQPEEEQFYAGLLVGEVRVPWCHHCDSHVWRPKSHCTTCYEPVAQWRVLAGTGEVYSFSVIHKGDGPFAAIGPYVIAWVSLDGGPMILADIANGASGEVAVGTRVRITVPGDTGGRKVGAVFEVAE